MNVDRGHEAVIATADRPPCERADEGILEQAVHRSAQ
jgi:hypothetical protein